MQRQVQIDNLRTHDPVMLEIVLQDALRRPLLQIETGTLVDMMALAEADGLPASMGRDLTAFVGRVTAEVSDLPDGGVLDAFAAELTALTPSRVPTGMRDILVAESTREDRAQSARERITGLLSTWSDEAPEQVVLVKAAPKIQKAEAVPSREKRIGGVVDDEPKTKTKAKRTRKPAPRKVGVTVSLDAECVSWIRAQVLARLAGKESGLSEMVLIAGIRHLAKGNYPRLLPNEVGGVLKTMKEDGTVRYSAGRWFVERRW